MKTCLAVADLFVPPDALRAGLAPLEALGYQVDCVEFDAGDYAGLQAACLAMEKNGPEAVPLSSELRERMVAADLLVVHFCPLPGSIIQAASKLRMIGSCRTGLSNVDVAAAEAAGVPVINARGRLADAVADFTVGLIICEARNIARGHEALRKGQWRRQYANSGAIPDLPGRTVGLVGLGAIGQGVARRLRAFGLRLLAADPYVSESLLSELGVVRVELDELMAQSDFVSVHVDVRPETRGLIDRRRIGLMRPNAYFINTARAEVVDEAALVEALQQGRIAGAGLDVFQTEPPAPDHPLLQLDNVTLTPHMSGGSDDALRHSPQLLCRLLIEALQNS